MVLWMFLEIVGMNVIDGCEEWMKCGVQVYRSGVVVREEDGGGMEKMRMLGVSTPRAGMFREVW